MSAIGLYLFLLEDLRLEENTMHPTECFVLHRVNSKHLRKKSDNPNKTTLFNVTPMWIMFKYGQ